MFLNSMSANSADLYRIRPATFDISNSVIYLPIKTNSAKPITNDIKYTKIEGENGVELEVPSATMDKQPEEVNYSEGCLKDFYISQSNGSVKIKMIFNENYNLSNLKIGNINNNIVISFGTLQPYYMNYYINTYREEESQKDYRESLLISTKVLNKQSIIPINDEVSKKSMSEVNQAFANSTYNGNEIYSTYTLENLTKNNRLRSRFFLDDIMIKDGVFRVVGVGTAGVQKPFLLENPLRMVFDIPNTTLNPKFHNTELKLENGDILKAAQFNPNTARLVITSEEAAQYIPVFTPDSQSILIANPKSLLTTHLPDKTTNIVKFTVQKLNKQENFLMELDKPLMYAIKRTKDDLYIYFLNAEKYNDNNFRSAIKNSSYSDLTVHLMSTGIRFKLPMKNKAKVNTFISPDGRVFKISYEEIKKANDDAKNEQKIKELAQKEGTITSQPKYSNLKNKNVVVIDAGHGGKDYGAIRNNINEKDINLDVCMRIQNLLQKKGYKVYMTRTNDTYVSLEDRTIFTEGINPAAFISVHVNSCNSESPNGIETHYYHEESIELADYVHKRLIQKIPNTTNRGLFKSKFYVINHTTVPAILVEIGFISNPSERAGLTTSQRKQATAEGITEGIIEFLKSIK